MVDAPGEIEWGKQRVETPLGKYMILGSEVMRLSDDKVWKTVYSAQYLRKSGNTWVQELTTEELGYRILATRPGSIIYDDHSGNLVVSMGIQGVVVGTREGQWIQTAVGPYSPTDFSFSNKTRLLLSHKPFLAAALSLTLSTTVFALIILKYRREDIEHGIGGVVVASAPIAILIVALAASGAGGVVIYSSPILILVAWVAAIIAAAKPKESRAQKNLALLASVPSLTAAGALLFMLGTSESSYDNTGLIIRTVFQVVAFVSVLPVLVYSWRSIVTYWRPMSLALVGMNVLVVLAFMLWVHLNIVLFLAQLSAAVLVALAGGVLVGHIRKELRPWY